MFKSYQDLFKNLREMQDQWWRESLAHVPEFELPADLNAWQKETLENMNSWAEKAVRQSLDLQQEWLGQWSERAAGIKLKPKFFSDLSEEARDSMQRWLENQNQLWEQWLKILKTSAGSADIPNLGDWQKTMQDSMQRQMALLEDWSKLTDFGKLSAREMTKLSGQIEKTMENSIEAQKQLWGVWFKDFGTPAKSAETKA